MKASEFLKKYEREQARRQERQNKRESDEEEGHTSLQAHAKERARHPEHMNAGTPFDWEDLEAYQKELERLEREGPGGSSGDPNKG